MLINENDLEFKIYNPGITTIENEIFWNGLEGWESNTFKLWKELSLRSRFIVDIGANTGIFSLIAAASNKKAEIFTFEPVKRTLKILKKNIELNKEFNIKLCEKAVSNRNGKTIFYDVNTPTQYSASLNSKMLENEENLITYDVETIKFDDFNIRNKKIDLVKIDVEMHEPEVIEGMLNTIKNSRP